MKVSVIGYGKRLDKQVIAFSSMEGVNLAGIYDLERENSPEFKDVTKNYSSFDNLLSKENPDIVSLCLPVNFTKEYVSKVAKKGIHVICEQPFASSLSEANEIIKVCNEHNVKLYITHFIRDNANYKDMKSSIEAGKIGNLGVIHRKHNEALNVDSEFDQNVDIVKDVLIEDIDLVYFLSGEVSRVYAMKKEKNDIKYSLVTLKCKNGTIANLEGLIGPGVIHEESIDIAGEIGEIRFNSNNVKSIRINNFNNPDNNYKILNPLKYDSRKEQLQRFIDCLKNDKEPIYSVEDSFHVLTTSFAALQSIKTGKPVDINTYLKESEELQWKN